MENPVTSLPREPAVPVPLRHDWRLEEVLELLAMPFNSLLFQAHSLYRRCFDPNRIQLSTLLNVKSGGCPEDCAYCPQSAHHRTGVRAQALLPVEKVRQQARAARAAGAGRFCMGAAWRSPPKRDFPRLLEMVQAVREEGLETCLTAGMLSADQARRLKAVGLDYYNHNIDCSEEYYGRIISTRTFQDRLETLERVRQAGVAVCCGGILGMGEGQRDRAGMLRTLANLPAHPRSVPINLLVRVAGTPLEQALPVDPLDLVRVVAVARLLMPFAYVRLSAGREQLSDELQALCFFAGANSVFYGERLLTTGNPGEDADRLLFTRLGLHTGT